MNTIRRIQISGFKSLANIDIELGQVNLLIGANGSGKSNLVSYFAMLNHMLTGALQLWIGKQGGAESILHFGSKRTPQLESRIIIETDKGDNEHYMRLVYAMADTLIFSEESLSFSGKGHPGPARRLPLGAGHKETTLLDEKLTDKTATVVRRLLSQCRFYQFHDTSDSSPIRQTAYIEDTRFLKSGGGNLAAFLRAMKEQAPSHYKRIAGVIQQVIPFFQDFVLEPRAENKKTVLLNWLHRDSERLLGPHQISDGSLRFMCLATLLLQPHPPSVIVIDEPELGLHPAALEILAELISSASVNSQLILATQSAHLVDLFETDTVIVAEQHHGASKFTRPPWGQLQEWLRDYSLSELWEKNVIGGRPGS